VGGQVTDIEIETHQIVQMRERLNRIFARETGKTYEQIVEKTERNFWMTASEAIEYGLASRVIEKITDI